MFAVQISTLSLAGLACETGCHHHHHREQPPQDLSTADWHLEAKQPLPATQRSVTALATNTVDAPVTDGSLPLVYLIGTEGAVQVKDLTTNQLLASSPVSHNSTVAVDSGRGVLVDGKVLQPGPLSADDRYGIFYAIHGDGDAFITATETNNPDVLRWRNPNARNASGVSATQSTTRAVPSSLP